MANMNPTSKCNAKVLNRIFDNLEIGASKKIDNSKSFMALSVEHLSETRYSMAHYFEQNGDLVCDPDLELYRCPKTGNWYPVALQASTGHYTRAITEVNENGEPTKFIPGAYSELCRFLTMWIRNLKIQQNL